MGTWCWKLANVDPFIVDWPKKWLSDPEIAPVILYLNRFLHDLFIRTGGGDDLIESVTQSASADEVTTRLSSVINALEKKVTDLELSNDTEILISKFVKLNQKVNKLISELLTAVKALAPDLEQESEKVVLLGNILDEIKLLNLRTEEAFDTKTNKDDIE